MTQTKKQQRYKRLYEEGMYWTNKKVCPVCGTEFYTLSSKQVVCGKKACENKWKSMQKQKNDV